MRRIPKLLTSAAATVFIAALVRLAYLFVFFHSQPPHISRYLIGEELGSIAASLAAGHGFSSPLYSPSGPTAWAMPVLPYLLAVVFRVFGTYTFHASVAIRSLNVLFSALTTYPIVRIGRKLFGETTGSVAGWTWAFLPMAITLPVSWVWEMSLAGLLLTTALWLTYELADSTDSGAWSLYGFVWGFTVLVNATVLCVFPGCLLFAAYRLKQRGSGWLRLASLTALVFALTISPWVIRNQVVFHGKVLLRSNFGLELWLGNNPEVPDTWSWWLHPLDSVKERDEFFKLGEVAYMERKKAAAIQFIKTHPRDVARFQVHRFLETWTGHSDSFADIWSTKLPLLRADLLLNYGLTLFTFLGLLFAYRTSPLLSLPLMNTLFFFPIVYYVCHTTPRYRHPIDPLLAILSAYAMVHGLQGIRMWTASKLTKNRAVNPSSIH